MTGLFWIPVACWAYFIVCVDSSTQSTDGETVAMMQVLQRPPSDSWGRRVSLLSHTALTQPSHDPPHNTSKRIRLSDTEEIPGAGA